VRAQPGAGGTASPGCGTGGAGGLGRIRISVGAGVDCSLGGAFDPPLEDGCAPASAAGKTFIATYPE
jgi:hypothetical protein